MRGMPKMAAARWLVLALALLLLAPAGLALSQASPRINQLVESALVAVAEGRESVQPAAAPAADTYTFTAVLKQANTIWRNIEFPSRNVGYAVGGPDWEASGTNTIAKTTDGGLTWTTTPFVGTTGFLRGLECTTDDKCWMVGRFARIYRTTDGGGSWTQLGANGVQGWMYSVANTQQGDGTVVGLTCDNPHFLQSDNGINFINANGPVPSCAVKYDITCPASGVCFSSARRGRVYKSFDNGKNWTVHNTGVDQTLLGIDCVNQYACWAVGDTGLIWKSTDRWATSTRQQPGLPSGMNFERVDMLDATHGYAVGCTQHDPNDIAICTGVGVIYRTDDGQTWREVARQPNGSLLDVFVHTMDDFYVVDDTDTIWHVSIPPAATATPLRRPLPPRRPHRRPRIRRPPPRRTRRRQRPP